jgi:hypothetical protein
MHKVAVAVVINSSISEKYKWLDLFHILILAYLNVFFNKIKNVNVSWHIAFFKSFI